MADSNLYSCSPFTESRYHTVTLGFFRYMYEELLGKNRSPIWDRDELWEGVFYDAVHVEREALGMNRCPQEMQDR